MVHVWTFLYWLFFWYSIEHPRLPELNIKLAAKNAHGCKIRLWTSPFRNVENEIKRGFKQEKWVRKIFEESIFLYPGKRLVDQAIYTTGWSPWTRFIDWFWIFWNYEFDIRSEILTIVFGKSGNYGSIQVYGLLPIGLLSLTAHQLSWWRGLNL